MNKADLIEVVKEKTGISKKVATECINNVFDTITDVVVDGDSVAIRGFGTFKAKTRAARMCRNPQTGELLPVSETKVPAFKASQSFKDAVKAS